MSDDLIINLYKFFKSVKLAVWLIAYLTLTPILATFVPQGQEEAFYISRYHHVLSWLILQTNFHNFFKSILFICPALVFTLNLLICTVDRIARELAGRRSKRFGPDLIHLGLLLLIAGALITFTQRQEGSFYLNEGEQTRIAGKYKVKLQKFEYEKYADGRPKDWISTISLLNLEDESVIVESFSIEVNHPFSYQEIKLYQTDFTEDLTLFLKDVQGDIFPILTGHPIIRDGDVVLVFEDLAIGESGSKEILIREYADETPGKQRRLFAGSRIGNFYIDDVRVIMSTGLTAVIDPGYLPVLIACIMLACGLMLTYFQKLGDKQI